MRNYIDASADLLLVSGGLVYFVFYGVALHLLRIVIIILNDSHLINLIAAVA